MGAEVAITRLEHTAVELRQRARRSEGQDRSRDLAGSGDRQTTRGLVQDEARVGQQGTLGAIWAEIGSRPPGVRDDRHDSAWLFGAVCSKRGVGAALVMPWVSSEAMTLHLRAIGAAVSPGAHAVLVCDGAGWHRTGGRLVVADDVTLLPLPAIRRS